MRVLLSGYYGFGNAGDEAMLAGLVEGFRQLAPEAELVVLSGDPAATMREHGVVAVPRGLCSAWQEVHRSDLVVSGGGGLLQDVTSFASPLYYLAIIRFGQWAGKPVACIGQSMGPLRRPLIRRITRKVLAGVQVVAVRDARSREALRELGLAREVEVTADAAFLLPRPTREEVSDARGVAGLGDYAGPVALVALRPTPDEGRPELARRLGEAIGEACHGAGLRPVLLPMQSGQDTAFAREAAGAMGAEALVAPGMPARQALALISGSDLVIGMRLHALILAAVAGIPLVGISYDPKVDGVLDQLGLEAATSIPRVDSVALCRAIATTWLDRAELARSLADRAEGLRGRALRNVELALGAARDRV